MNNNNPTTDEIMQRRRFLAQLAGAGITTLGMNEPRAFSAEKIAENGGGSLGKLMYADMGIFQITAENSSEEYEWGGTFNTVDREKTATITVKLRYEVR